MIDRQNLLEETIKYITSMGKTVEDVQWTGYKDGTKTASWAEFALLAKDINYDSGYGGNEIPLNLVVVGSDWWLERHEYDGSEWWEFKTLPKRQQATLPMLIMDESNEDDR